jgi:hypothetical protein
MQPTQISSQPVQPTPQPAPTTPIGPQATYEPRQQRIEQRAQSRKHYKEAGIPIWGVLLILVGLSVLFEGFGFGIGWVFGLALGVWFVYLGVRNVQQGEAVNWWLVGLGLLIGLGAISASFADELVFPIVLVLVGLGILGEYVLNRQKQSL